MLLGIPSLMEFSQKKDNQNLLNETYYQLIDLKYFEEIAIIVEGNCFYRCLSQHQDLTQENHHYYRELIFNYIHGKKNELKKFFFKEENETDEEYNNRYNSFNEAIKNTGNYAGDFEISAASSYYKRI